MKNYELTKEDKARKRRISELLEKLDKVFEFYEENKRLPETNLEDKYETKLYDFFRKLDIEKYKCDIDPKIIKKINLIKEENKIRKAKRKTKNKIETKRNYITKCINNYYDFYIKNGYFASDCAYLTKEEKNICKDYNNIIKFRKLFTNEHIYKINMINDIKDNNKYLSKLMKIKRYINFMKKYDKTPSHVSSKLNDNDSFSKYELRTYDYIANLNLEDIIIPYRLIEELNDELNKVSKIKEEKKKANVNYVTKKLIDFMNENKMSCANKNGTITNLNGREISFDGAVKYIKNNVGVIDKKLIKEYNSFNFITKKLNSNNKKFTNKAHIKKLEKNMEVIQKLEEYISFCKKYKTIPYITTKKVEYRNYVEDQMVSLAWFMKRIKLDEVYIPYNLIEELYNVTEEIGENDLKEKFNCLILEIINNVKTLNVLPQSINSKDYIIRGINGNVISLPYADKIMRKNLKYIDDSLIKEYNKTIKHFNNSEINIKYLKK